MMEKCSWLFKLLCFLILILLSQTIISSSVSFSSSRHLCPLDQNLALLQFKNVFSLNKCSYHDSFIGNLPGTKPRKIVSWKEGSDCCLWDGVSCDNVTGNVIGLDLKDCNLHGTIDSNNTLFLLSHLRRLELSENRFCLSQFPSTISQLPSLTHLNLSYSDLSGFVPKQISHLSKLVSIDLSSNNYLYFESSVMKRLVQNITELKELILSGVSMPDVAPHSLVNISSCLTSLDLGFCYLGGYHGGEFPVNIFKLPNIQFLDLSGNPMMVNFPKSNWTSPLRDLQVIGTRFAVHLPKCIGGLKSLEHLSVDGRGEIPNSIGNLVSLKAFTLMGVFSGSIPASIGNLSQLKELNFSWNNFQGELPSSLAKLENLISLDLQSNNFTGEIPNAFTNLTKLSIISLQSNKFNGQLPSSLFNLTQLVQVDFADNQIIGHIPISDISSHGGLVSLDLSHNSLKGSVPSWLFALPLLNSLQLSHNQLDGFVDDFQVNSSQLVDVDLSHNKLQGQIPMSLFQLEHLSRLSLRSNKFDGQLPSSLFNLTKPLLAHFADNHAGLVSLDISHNSLKGSVPSWLFGRPLLHNLNLSHNQLDGYIEEFQVNSSHLAHVDISNNKLQGQIPRSLFQLEHLSRLSLSSNNMTGFLDQKMISSLKNLHSLDLSGNTLSFSLPPSSNEKFSFPMLSVLRLSSCNIEEIPIFLRGLKFVDVDLSNNKIQGSIPEWIWGVGESMRSLNLSHNSLTSFGRIPWNWSGELFLLDLRSNLIQGPLPTALLLGLYDVFLANNKLTGEIPPSICNGSFGIVALSNNNLNGSIPECLGDVSSDVLDLRMNNFHGVIPASMFANCGLRTLGLNGNQLEGPLPHSLVNCKGLEVLDVGNNRITGEFPHWLGSLPKLQVLVLRSNKFQGLILNSKTKFPFPMLRIMDASDNGFTGPLPVSLFKNLKAMMDVGRFESKLEYMGEMNGYYQDSLMVTMKGLNLTLVKILTIFTTIDLSNNNFTGKIPTNIGKLKSLKGLNLSHNSLVGHIPSSMGSLTNIEWLDLSSNQLSGKIPDKLLDLTFLEVFNLSYNKLEGQIPFGRQFNTFSNDSYVGNLGLCGFPLSKKCNRSETGQSTLPSFGPKRNVSGLEFEFGWKVVLLGYGCGFIFGLIIGYMVFTTGKPQWVVRLVEGNQPRKQRRSKQGGGRLHRRRN
ncbi:hypothetical protein COLO4_17410 [Corchorus olitorius]|uniref:Disease resistance R13L4/SHOC-2-like LRR domain-containing protein n=1 Tax=Corchorus olitorius TaxID=93759 RepID=A0A1R3JCX0_9ROSI|nr:hypothetical protein COLO4_17410 [Corchorus olitorius]